MALRRNSRIADNKFVKMQTRKAISSYGGSGSIIETPFGALMIDKFDQWPFFRFNVKDGQTVIDASYHISDERLLQRLSHKDGFEKLEAFVYVPDNVSSSSRADVPEHQNDTISASFFPKWFYCNSCKRFKHINDWWREWSLAKSNATKKEFAPPKCGVCYAKRGSKFAPELEQVRFVMTAPNGDIKDIPWERWNKAQKAVQDEDTENGSVRLDYEALCCENPDLRYSKSTKFSDLAGISIKCMNDGCSHKGRMMNLSGLFGLRERKYFTEEELLGRHDRKMESKVYFKPVIRSSNSVYYPILVSSIFLPIDKGLLNKDIEKINRFKSKGKDAEFIYEALEEKYPLEQIQEILKNDNDMIYIPELEYRLYEYNFLVKNSNIDFTDEDENLIFKKESLSKLNSFGFEQIIGLRRIKMTTAQLGYTRQEPLTNDDFFSNMDETQMLIEKKFTSKWADKTKYLPAIESFGEGIFIALSHDKIESWIIQAETNEHFKNKINKLYLNIESHAYRSVKEKFGMPVDREHLIRFILVHTLSHLLIKELEFLCGYPSTSLNERLFVDRDQMQGVLLYTIAGAEGSYGGLVSQAPETQILRLLKSALRRASDCASDPICYNTDDGQGVGGLNMAACYSCTLIPENACEEFNSFLDRSLLIDEAYGFFKGLLN
ncbi:uncharacterized protein DUF1998 [Gelidibacter algens]|uniref:Uncharacterized protein DUF1998 n=1 Tax=Gelidibacter algens TaxID=49280 RepID=A0A1A7QQI2_9FLAO|nr:DUF1998 domain-containing protein [Gelidibacter algens]OBX21583.1 hypothetical protein A9996_17945 [Gelidibacter algens]RAJ21135.1 uncharacterized protein DUF1998 [Gelidibacter algens]